MKQLKHDTTAFMEMSVETHEVFQYIKPYTVDYRLLQTALTKQNDSILASIEAYTNQAASFSKFSKDIVEYASSLQQAALKYIDVITKQCKLAKESIEPLLKANQVFKAIYGKEKLDSLASTRVTYYEKNNHKDYPFEILEELSNVVTQCKDDDIKYTCVKLLKCKYTNSQLDYPKIPTLTNSKTASLESLGHTVDTFSKELEYLTGGIDKSNIPAYTQLAQNKSSIVSTINNRNKAIVDQSKKLKSITDVQNIMRLASDLQGYTVALSSIMFLLQSVSYTAYEAGYSLHLAEISYNNKS